VSKKRRNSNVVRFSVLGAGATPADPGRKLSDIMKEMALRLLKRPDGMASRPAIEAALILATAAWNAALGDYLFRNQHRELLAKCEWGDASPWAELRATDTDQLIAELVEYKRARFPEDDRLIVAAGLSPEDQVQVHWSDHGKVAAAVNTALFGLTVSEEAAVTPRADHPVAEKIVARIKREVQGKVTDLKAVVAGRTAADEIQKSVVSTEALAALHPAHAAYVYALNQVSLLAEQLASLDELAPLVKLLSKAEDEYLPSGPPMSPLTRSFFSCWSFFDARVGSGDETIGTTVLKVGAIFGMAPELLRLVQLMQDSRMGVYLHEGREGDLAALRELATGEGCRAVVPSGYRGQRGELWYARVLPPPVPGGAEHVVLTTPYVLLRPGPREWRAYFARTLPGASRAAYERHMKYGPTNSYWTEFVFEGYVNHQAEVIYLAGLPDIEKSRPHSRVNS